jgi:hypothetical protein
VLSYYSQDENKIINPNQYLQGHYKYQRKESRKEKVSFRSRLYVLKKVIPLEFCKKAPPGS